MRVGVRPLVDTDVTPDQITTIRLVTGVTAAGMFAVGDGPWHYVGAAVFIVSTFLDRADGELARMTGKCSTWGHTYDIVADTLCNVLLFLGIGIGLRYSALGHWSIFMGVAAGIAVAITLYIVMRVESLEGSRAAELGGFAGFDADDAILLVPLAMVTGLEIPTLVAAAVVAPIFAVGFAWKFRHGLQDMTLPSFARPGSSSSPPGAAATVSPVSIGSRWQPPPPPPERKA